MVEGATGYTVCRADTASGEYTQLCSTIETGYTNSRVESGRTYYYRVKAVCGNADASSADSAAVSIRANNEIAEAGYDLRYVNSTSLYIYKSPDSSSRSLRLFYMVELELGDVVTVSAGGKWQEVFYKGDLYYIWLTPDSDKLTVNKSAMEYTASNGFQQEVLDLAMTIYNDWHVQYVFGDVCVEYEDGTVGFDCSGFATYVINTVMQQYAPAYRPTPQTGSLLRTYDVLNTGLTGEFRAFDVAIEDAQVGDMILFKSTSTGEVNHCGLYMGNNEFLHCTSAWDDGEAPTSSDVGLMTLSGSYMDRLICIRRYIPESVEPANATFYAAQGCPIYSDCRGKEKTDMRLTRGEAITVLYTRPTTSNGIAYIRTADDYYGFVWTSNLSAAE